MKKICSFLTVLSTTVCVAQGREFKDNNNGLIYSDSAIKELKHIVDSLNLKFSICENKTYYATMQSQAVYINLEGKKGASLKSDIEKGVKLSEIKEKYPDVVVIDNVVAVRHTYKDYDNKEVLHFEVLNTSPDDNYELYFREGRKEFKKYKNIKQGWIYDYDEPDKYSSGGLSAIYIKNALTPKVMNEEYARLVQYSECLVDTTATVYFKEAKKTGVYYGYDTGHVNKFMEYLYDKIQKPRFDYDVFEEEMEKIRSDSTVTDSVFSLLENERYAQYHKKMDKWEAQRLSRVDSLMREDKKLKKLFDKALDAVLKQEDISNDEFEEYVGIYSSKENELFLKRNRRVIGGCSMDDSPRVHAMNIAELAGETAKWEIFLRSHLDIMNDRFDRVSDGSYAWAGRKTYIKELEVLDINVNDLLLGICLRVENPSQNHYYGSLSRIGRSLAEAKDKAIIENSILEMIKSNKLDDYNRLLMYYLFLNYNAFLEDGALKEVNKNKLKNAVNYLPKYLQPE